MAHSFSVEIHNYINEKIQDAEEKKKAAKEQGDVDTYRFFKGCL